eukprot:c53254_g1_i1 orf=583-1266(-)
MRPLTSSPLTFGAFFFLCVLSPFSCRSQEDDTACLQEIKQSLDDPLGYLSNWVFESNAAGYMCKFYGVKCWEADQSRVFSLSLSNCSLSGEFPMGLSKCSSIRKLDLSLNRFHGVIPTNSCSMTPGLTSFKLSWNNFSGGISNNLTDCAQLEELDLQHNQLSGIIPWEIGLLPNLTSFDASYNNFAGQIPDTMTSRAAINQSAFPASSFIGNPGLCGAPLNNTCVGM